MALTWLAGCGGTPDALPDPDEAPVWVAHGAVRLTPDGRQASEVSVAVDPTDALHAVAAANSEGGLALHVTRDGGATWSAGRLDPGAIDAAAGVARFQSLADPALAFAPDGTVYLAGLAYIPTSSVFVARSPDGGDTWDPVVVHESDIVAGFNDKEWIAAGPNGLVVAAWQKEPALDQLRALEQLLGGRADLDVGDVVVSVSRDAGATWTAPRKVSAGLHNNGTQVAFSPSGTIHLLWVDYEAPGLVHAKSTDQGATWSAPAAVADLSMVGSYARYPRMHTLPALAASPVDGTLHAIWHDDRAGDADVLVATSVDEGATWGEPRAIGGPGIQFYPWGAVDLAGTLHLGYYNETEPGTFVYGHWTAGQGFLPLREPFGVFAASDGGAPELVLGDYTGVAAAGGRVYAAWSAGEDGAELVEAAVLTPA